MSSRQRGIAAAGTPSADGTRGGWAGAAAATVIFRVLAVGLGALHAGAAMLRESMNEDGISYMDLGDAILRGDWSTAVNSVWSPLYAVLLGATLRIADPALRWEFPTVHLVNFGIYLVALTCFEFFWRELTNAVRGARRDSGLAGPLAFPEWAWVSLGYALFIWSSLALIEIWSVTPDMLLAALVYLAAGLLLRIGPGEASLRTYAAYGLVLGLAYLTKAVMLPLACAFLGAAAVAPPGRGRALPRVLLAASVFLALALPFMAVLSFSKGRFTFGEVGRLTYLRYVNGVPYPHWRPEAVPGVSAPEHPPRRIFRDPPVYEFATPVGGTYPLSYDPS